MGNFNSLMRALAAPGKDEKAVGDIIPLSLDSKGNHHLALPEGIRSLLRGAADANTAGQQGIPVGQTATPDLTNLVMALGMGAGAGFGPKAVGNEAVSGIFAGKRAIPVRTRSMVGPLKRAGASDEEIFDRTGGVFVGPEGAPRIEIPDPPPQVPRGLKWHTEPDPSSTLNTGKAGWLSGPDLMGEPLFVGNMIDHPELFKHYPELAQIPVKSTGLNFGVSGSYNPANKVMRLAGGMPASVYSTIIHELQHAVQDIEGHSNGGNTASFFTPEMSDLKQRHQTVWNDYKKNIPKEVNEYSLARLMQDVIGKKADKAHMERWYPHEYSFLQSLNSDTFKQLQTAQNSRIAAEKMDDEAAKMYYALAGEVEARNAESRIGGAHLASDKSENWNIDTRGELGNGNDPKYPWNTMSHPMKDQMIWTGNVPDSVTDIAPYLIHPDGRPIEPLDARIFNILKGLR